MLWIALVFWLCFGVFAYTYFLYPLLLGVLARLFGKPRKVEKFTPSVSFILSVHNEEKNLQRRLPELVGLIEKLGVRGEVLLVSDASTDGSVALARTFADKNIIVLVQTTKQGKAAALNRAASVATGEVLIFADARQRWADDALERLLENFADARIGAVSGDLVLENSSGVLAGVGAYWKFEKWLRKTESHLHSQVGVTGAIAACRKELFTPVPAGTILDDVFWPVHVALKGYRVVHDERAKAYDRLPEKTEDEFRRKVRTLAGNFQLLTRLPLKAFFPWSNKIWWQGLSHKVFRLLAPWALLGMLVTSFFQEGAFYQTFFWLQIAGYVAALLGTVGVVGSKVKLLGTAGSFFVLNLAAWVAFWVWVSGRAGKSWHKVQYNPPVPVTSN